MTIKLNRRSKVGLGIATFAAVAATLPIAGIVEAALPPQNTPSSGAAVLSPSTVKTSGTTFQLNVPAGSVCPGDAVAGHRLTTFIVPAATDSSQLTFTPVTGKPNGAASGFTSVLKDPGGINITSQSDLSIGTGLIVLPTGGFTASLQAIAVPAGNYKIGIACTLNLGTGLGIETTKFWETTTTVAAATGAGPQNFIWGNPVAPAAPTLTTPSATAAVPTVNFSLAPTIGALSNLTATVTPTAGGSPINVPIATQAFPNTTGSFTIPGLTLGTTYGVTVTATNGTGTSAASTSLTLSPSETREVPVVQAATTFTDGVAVLNWSAVPDATSYDVVVTGPNPASTTVFSRTLAAGTAVVGTTVTDPAPTAPAVRDVGTYTVRVTPNFPAGFSAVAPGFGVGALTVNPNALIFQDITVERPAGALVLTQRCGVYGLIPEYGTVGTPAVVFPTTGFPGYPKLLGTLPAIAAGTGITNAPPVVAPGIIAATDPLYGSYPQLGSYPTLCNVTLGNPTLVTSGPLTGQYYAADGRLNQVTVLNTRNTAAGWVANGDIANQFKQGTGTSTENNSFSGDLLGWIPQVTSKSATQTVTAGPVVLPGTAGGLTANPVFAFSPSGQSLGIAELDARLMVLVPVTADSGLYTARMSLTVI